MGEYDIALGVLRAVDDPDRDGWRDLRWALVDLLGEDVDDAIEAAFAAHFRYRDGSPVLANCRKPGPPAGYPGAGLDLRAELGDRLAHPLASVRAAAAAALSHQHDGAVELLEVVCHRLAIETDPETLCVLLGCVGLNGTIERLRFVAPLEYDDRPPVRLAALLAHVLIDPADRPALKALVRSAVELAPLPDVDRVAPMVLEGYRSLDAGVYWILSEIDAHDENLRLTLLLGVAAADPESTRWTVEEAFQLVLASPSTTIAQRGVLHPTALQLLEGLVANDGAWTGGVAASLLEARGLPATRAALEAFVRSSRPVTDRSG